jgi:hypothetical protein
MKIIVRLQEEVARTNKQVEVFVSVGDELEITYVTLVDTHDELVSAKNVIKRNNEAITLIRGQLKEAHQSTTNLSLARDRLIKTTKSIIIKATVHDVSADKRSTASCKPFHATQYLSLKTNKIDAISLDAIHLREELREAALFAESLKEELLERTTYPMAVYEDNEVLRGMQLDAELRRDLEDHREDERDLQTMLGGSDKGRGKWKRITEKLFKSRILKPLLIALTVKRASWTCITVSIYAILTT